MTKLVMLTSKVSLSNIKKKTDTIFEISDQKYFKISQKHSRNKVVVTLCYCCYHGQNTFISFIRKFFTTFVPIFSSFYHK